MSLKNLDFSKIKLPLEAFERNNLTPIAPPNQLFSVFSSIASHLSLTEQLTKKIQNKVLNWLMVYYDNLAFPIELDFLKNEPQFFDLYQQNQGSHAFDMLNLLLGALSLNATFELLFAVPNNRNFIGTVFNPGCQVTLYFFVNTVGQTRNFVALSHQETTKEMAKLISDWKEKAIDDLKDDTEPIPPLPTSTSNESLAKADSLLRKHLMCFDQVRSHYIDVETQQKMLQSAQKEVLPVFSFETRSIAKTGEAGKQQFDFSDKKQKQLDPPVDPALMEPDYFLNKKPPGLFSESYQSNVIVFGKTAEDKKDSAHGTPIKNNPPSSASSKRKVFFANTHPKLDRSKRYTGKMQNFYTDRGYGFLVIDGYPFNIFVHFDDLHKGGVTADMLRRKENFQITFNLVSYQGNGNSENVKASNVELVKR